MDTTDGLSILDPSERERSLAYGAFSAGALRALFLVVQRANDWEDAISLCNGVKQGLVAALFSDSKNLIEDFLGRAKAGILKINSSTADAAVDLPFGGWKASGFGPPEHGPANREFFTRMQAIYFP